jgi:serine/threonine protein kinase
MLAGGEAKQRFEREARTISSLNHPNICTLHHIGNQDGTSYLVMEYVEGETLDARLQGGPLPSKQALERGIQICDALEKAHRAGIVHSNPFRTGKPELREPEVAFWEASSHFLERRV